MDYIPKISVSDLQRSCSDSARRACGKRLVEALADSGFAYITEHRISLALQEQLAELAENFFGLPEADKLRIRMENRGRAWKGYFPVGKELTSGMPDQKEGLYFGTELPTDDPRVQQQVPMHGPNQFPELSGLDSRTIVLSYMKEMENLGALLMEGVAMGLGLEAKYFAKRFTNEPTLLFRIFHYPPTDWNQHQKLWSVGEHTDMGFLTILKQDNSGGLEVQTPDGAWMSAPPVPNSFVVNIGDMLEYWTWGILKATHHRVRNPGAAPRLSYPFFYDPHWQGSLERIDRSLLTPDLLRRERKSVLRKWDQVDLNQLSHGITYGDFVWEKIKTVFPDLAKV